MINNENDRITSLEGRCDDLAAAPGPTSEAKLNRASSYSDVLNKAALNELVQKHALAVNDHPKIWQPTMLLRWRKPEADPILALLEAVNGRESLILQQAWSELATGEVDWRDVPKV